MSKRLSDSILVLKQLYNLRNITIIFIVILVLLAKFILLINLPIIPLSLVLMVMMAVNVFTLSFVTHKKKVSDNEIFFQLLFDILLFSVILFLMGGATNPFTFLYLIPIAISATIITGVRAWVLTITSILLYGVLLKFYVPLGYQLESYEFSMMSDGQFTQHVFGMWFGFLLSSVLVTWFISYLSKGIKRREQMIADAKQRELRDQQMVTLGSLAAGTAHELGTPLATLSIVAEEITSGYNKAENMELFENQSILSEQIKRCKRILSSLADTVGESRADTGALVSVESFLSLLLSDWKSQRPNVQYATHFDWPSESSLRLLNDKTIFQAIINLLNNAVDASEDTIEIKAYEKENQLMIEVIDNGKGFSDEQLKKMGEVSFGNKPNGIGIGLFLAITTIRRSGGDIFFDTLAKGGTRTLIKLVLIQ
ncbi:MAG: ATP-binding protein [Gammaproteobacteria bacterium]|nr:ATP-binding protein [Gammaproteobacteria bacterium]